MVDISIVIPTMNEEAAIGQVLTETIAALKKGGLEFEMIIVDTNSKDQTVPIAKSMGARVIDEPLRGYGRAYKTGFANAKGEFIATLDADCTYPAYEIPRMVKMLREEKLDFITCDRLSTLEKGVMSAKHRFGNWVLAKGTNVLFGLKLADSQTGMWVFRRAILGKIKLTSDGMPLSEEIKIEAFTRPGIKAKEVPVKYSPRKGEVKLNSWQDGKRNFKFLFEKRKMLKAEKKK